MPKRTAAVLLMALAVLASGNSKSFAQISMATVPIGDPGNAADPATGAGAVNYTYQMGTYNVTVSQYAAFLNSVAASDPYGLYKTQMGTDLNVAGIARSGSSGSYTYSVIGSSGNDPITYVFWSDAARFANWMSNGQPKGAEGPGTTETGSYTLNGMTTGFDSVTRNANATWVLPTENEWYKAAFYQPASQGGPASSYWSYPTQSNTAPTSHAPPGAANSANYEGTGGYAVTGSTTLSSSQNYLTPVGAYTHSASFFGTYDQGADVGDWNETSYGGIWRGLSGSAWDSPAWQLASNDIYAFPDLTAVSDVGFRIAFVPEPSAGILALTALAALGWWRKRFGF